jgi:hypothetical protein
MAADAAEAAAPAERRAGQPKPTAWQLAVAAAGLPSLPPTIVPTRAQATELRDKRLALVRAFWPREDGPGGRTECAMCREAQPRMAWRQCRGRGRGTRNAHGPRVPDFAPERFRDGCGVTCVGFAGNVRAYDEVTGYFTVECVDGQTREAFLPHASLKAQVGALSAAAARAVRFLAARAV